MMTELRTSVMGVVLLAIVALVIWQEHRTRLVAETAVLRARAAILRDVEFKLTD
jgi:hypothetical protein